MSELKSGYYWARWKTLSSGIGEGDWFIIEYDQHDKEVYVHGKEDSVSINRLEIDPTPITRNGE